MAERADELRRQLIRNFHSLPLERQQRAPLYDTLCGSVSAGTLAKKLGAGFDVLAPGMRSCPYHLHHAQEEMFIVIEGAGHLRVAGELLPIGAGDVMFIPAGPEFPHQIVNTSEAPLKYLSISTQERPEVCEYPDSAKYAAYGGGFNATQRRSADLDYWDGEP